MGFVRRRLNLRAGKVDNVMRRGDQKFAQDASEVMQELTECFVHTFELYRELAPDGPELRQKERRAVRNRLEANAVRLREVQAKAELVEYLALKRSMDFRPVVEVVRMMQRSLILALSDDPLRRRRAISRQDLQAFVGTQAAFLSEVYATPAHNQPASD